MINALRLVPELRGLGPCPAVVETWGPPSLSRRSNTPRVRSAGLATSPRTPPPFPGSGRASEHHETHESGPPPPSIGDGLSCIQDLVRRPVISFRHHGASPPPLL